MEVNAQDWLHHGGVVAGVIFGIAGHILKKVIQVREELPKLMPDTLALAICSI